MIHKNDVKVNNCITEKPQYGKIKDTEDKEGGFIFIRRE